MSAGRISMRYAKALYRYACEQGVEEAIYNCMKKLRDFLRKAKEIEPILKNPSLGVDVKVEAVCGCVSQLQEFRNFVTLVVKAQREDLLLNIAYSFVSLYRKNKGILNIKITTAVPMSADTRNDIASFVSQHKNAGVEIVNIVEPSIIGGFISQADYKRIDASVRGQLDTIRKTLVKETRKLV